MPLNAGGIFCMRSCHFQKCNTQNTIIAICVLLDFKYGRPVFSKMVLIYQKIILKRA